MTGVHLGNLLVVVALAFLVPLALGFVPTLKLPAVVLEIVAGIVVGPSVLGWVTIDEPLSVLALIGLAFLLFLAGLEIDIHELQGRPLRLATLGFIISFVIALGVGLGLRTADLAGNGLFVAIVLTATSLGIIVPVLKDAGEISSPFGQLVVAAGSIADFGAIILLSLLFSREGGGVGSQAILLGGFVVVAGAIGLAVAGAERLPALSQVLFRLQDTTAQIRIRGAFLLLIVFAFVAERLGLETILGAFMAGALLTLLDRDRQMTHPDFRSKLESAGFGIFIPIFFVVSGVRFDVDALTSSIGALARVPIFLLALLAVRGLPALLYRSELGSRRTAVAALLQATSLPFIVAATQIGLELETISAETAAGLVGAGILSVLLFPLGALTLLRAGSAARLKP
ncbi:cation:proton antiporter [Gaiella sp.]|uniref:cation:proton antiporter n=1 Tax=Gaiella sp. TaxID=2663207 RepID=UPI00398357F6